MRLVVPLALSLAAAAPVSAQGTDWSYAAVIYAWLPGIDSSFETEFGTVESSLSTGDVLDDLDFAFMGAFEARTGNWSLIGDLLYSRLSDGRATPRGVLFSEATLKTSVTALTGYALYRLSGDAPVAADLGLGFRAFNVTADATLTSASRLETRSASGDSNWVDPLIAGRLIVPFDDLWSGTLIADAGGTGASDTWQALATVNYRISDAWSVNAGYRYMSIEKELSGIPTTLDLSGPLIGFSYRF
jgi:opacity protein-like surface antigen